MSDNHGAPCTQDPQNRPDVPLIAILAHELRNPLQSIMFALRALRGRRDREPMARQACDIAEHQARHMARIIEDVLDLCRAGQGKLSLRKERLDLAAVVAEDAIETAGRSFLAARGHHLDGFASPGPVSLVADPSRLNQILTNLLTNAAKYTDPGGEICVAAEVAAGRGGSPGVSDNGKGSPRTCCLGSSTCSRRGMGQATRRTADSGSDLAAGEVAGGTAWRQSRGVERWPRQGLAVRRPLARLCPERRRRPCPMSNRNPRRDSPSEVGTCIRAFRS